MTTMLFRVPGWPSHLQGWPENHDGRQLPETGDGSSSTGGLARSHFPAAAMTGLFYSQVGMASEFWTPRGQISHIVT